MSGLYTYLERAVESLDGYLWVLCGVLGNTWLGLNPVGNLWSGPTRRTCVLASARLVQATDDFIRQLCHSSRK